MLPASATGGTFGLVEHDLPARQLGSPVHTHEREDEYSYVLSGRLTAQVGDSVIEAGPGELVVKPRGIPHTFWNTEPSRSASSSSSLRAVSRSTSSSSPRRSTPRTSPRWARSSAATGWT